MDIATLGIKVENGDVIKATTSLNTMAVAGAKTEAATQRLTRRMALMEIEARNMDAAMGRSSLSLTGLVTSMGATEEQAAHLSKAFGALSIAAALGFIGHKTIEETEAAQAAMAQLEAAVKSTGGVAGRSVDQLDALSMAMQRTTTYSDEAVKGAESMLLTFDKIRGLEFDRATQSVADLATRMGGDLQGAAVQVGKALQDPEHGLTALRRSGVSFSESQVELIKTLFDTGRVAEGQRIILKELEHQFGGSAAAARDTLGGALAGLKNAWGDLFEVTKGATRGTVDGINAITDSLSRFGLNMNTIVSDAVKDWATMTSSVVTFQRIMSMDLSKGNILARIKEIRDEENIKLTDELARLNAKVAAGPAQIAKPAGSDPGKAALDAAKKAAEAAKKQREDNADLVRDAEQQASLTLLVGAAQERARIEYEATNKAIKARRELTGDLLDETLKAIEAEKQWNLVGMNRKLMSDELDVAKKEIDSFADRFADKMGKAFGKLFGHDSPLRTLFEGLSTQLVRSWSERFIAPVMAAMGRIQYDVLAQQRGGSINDIADASKSMGPSRGMGAAGIGIAGLGVGYGVGTSLYSSSHGAAGNYARGALGGAASGAAMGAMLGSVVPGIGTAIGAIVGGAAGFIGGVLGMGSAAKEAAKAMAEAQKQVALSMAALRAEVNKDPIAAGVAQIEADREARRQAIEDAYSGGGAGSEQVRKRNAALAEMNRLEDQRIAQLAQEAQAMKQAAREDIQVRSLRNQNQGLQADILAKQLADQREYAKAVADQMDPTYLAQLKWNQAIEENAVATGKAAGAISALTSGLNEVAGYKDTLQSLVYDYRAPGAGGGLDTSPSIPMAPTWPTAPTSTLPGRMGGNPASVQPVTATLVVNLDSREIARTTKELFQSDAQREFGDSTRWAETA